METQTSTAVNVARDHINAWVIKIGKKPEKCWQQMCTP